MNPKSNYIPFYRENQERKVSQCVGLRLKLSFLLVSVREKKEDENDQVTIFRKASYYSQRGIKKSYATNRGVFIFAKLASSYPKTTYNC